MGAHQQGHPFFRRYGVNLPSSLTRVLSIALVSSTYLPVSVCGTGTICSNTARGFSWQCGVDDSSAPKSTLVLASPVPPGTSLRELATRGHGPCPLGPLVSTLLRHPTAHTWWQRNINRLSIAYAFRPRLRPG